MNTEAIAITAILTIISLINLFASYKCIKSPFFDVKKKLCQLIFLWLVPIAGAIFILHFAASMNLGPDYKTTDAHPATLQKLGLGELSEVNDPDD